MAGIAVAVAAVLGSVAVVAQADAPGRPRRLPPAVRATMQQDADALLVQGTPGVLAQLQTPRGQVKVRSGYGNLTTRTPVPWTAEFRIGSFTKTFVSATLLQLVGEHRLSLDDTVDRWLPGVVRGNGNDGRKITVRQLLQHTSGVPEFLQALPWTHEQEGFEKHRFDTVTAQQAVSLAMRYKPVFTPGTKWEYSNTNYVLVGMIINRVGGHSWQQEVENRIVKPLGLRHTVLPRTSPDIPQPHAVGYERFPGPGATPEDPKYGEFIDATLQNVSWGGPAGEIISTTDDGNRFLQALIGGRVLRPAQLAEMEHAVPTDAAFRASWPGARYGLGLVWIPNSCGGSWAHGGDIMGFRTRNGVSPDGRRSVMVSFNTDSTKPEPGAPEVTGDLAASLIDHALCGSR